MFVFAYKICMTNMKVLRFIELYDLLSEFPEWWNAHSAEYE